jgi:hypothetical protein
VLAAAGLVVLAGGLATAQPPQRGGGRGGFGGGMMTGPGLLMNKSVQQELKLTDDQIKKIDETVKEVREKHQDEFQALRDASQEERREKGAALMRKVGEETHKALAGVLKPDQEKRFKQIELQVRGAQAFTDPDVQKQLKLTEDQQDKIKTINEDAQKEMRSAREGGGGPGGFQKMAEIRKEAAEKSVSVLSADQKAQWKEMTGAPFEVRFEAPAGGRGGRGGAKRGGGDKQDN